MAGWPDGTKLVVIKASDALRSWDILWGDVLVAEGGAVALDGIVCQRIDHDSLRQATRDLWAASAYADGRMAIPVECLRPLLGDDDPAAEPEEIEDVQTESV